MRPVTLLALVALLTPALACDDGSSVALDAFDVTITQVSQCTVTGQFARNCDDPAVLGQTTLQARWFLERADDGVSVAVTTHEGRTIPGVTFDNDGAVIAVDGCNGEGGRCVFVRRRFESADANNNNCATFGELIFVGHFPSDEPDHLVGRFSDVAGNTEECGTPTVNEVAFSVDGTKVEQAARSLEEAQP